MSQMESAMKTTKVDMLLEAMIAHATNIGFKPIAAYNKRMDIIEAIWQDCSFYTEWLNDEITIMRKMHDDGKGKKGDIVGVQIWALNDDGKSKRIVDIIPPPPPPQLQQTTIHAGQVEFRL
jgi:hypothetical protein